MRNIVGSKYYSQILDILLDPADPIIESDNSWHNSQGKTDIGFCKGYRITQKYNSGEICYKSLPHKLGERIEKYQKEISQ